jgi:acetyltransferase-like isoleucine patch superfamily enzyme
MSDPYLQPQQPPMTTMGWVAVEPYKIGRHTYVSEFSHIAQNTVIGAFCSIGNLCTIGAQKHRLDCLTSFPFEEILVTQAPQVTVLGSDVWVGSNSVVMAGVLVEHGAVIGAGSVVTKNVPPYAIVVGNPARVLRYRFPPEIIHGLLETKWWDLPAEQIKKLPLADPERCIALIKGQG